MSYVLLAVSYIVAASISASLVIGARRLKRDPARTREAFFLVGVTMFSTVMTGSIGTIALAIIEGLTPLAIAFLVVASILLSQLSIWFILLGTMKEDSE